MIFHQILIQILQVLNNERTVSSAYHLLKGKRSGQTIQDVGIFKLHAYFSLLPKLKRTTFDEAIQQLERDGYLTIFEDGFYEMTSQTMQTSNLYFNGWHYRGNEHIFFARLSLVIETLSHVKMAIRYFAPTEKNQEIQRFVRSYLRNQPFTQASFRETFQQELIQVLEQASITEMQRELFVSRLTGVDTIGSTWKQLVDRYELEQMDLYFIYISTLHHVLDVIIEKQNSVLFELCAGIETTTPLTESTQITANYVQQGYAIDQIALIRQLKASTIEDHIVEMAMNIPAFSVQSFMTASDLKRILQTSEDYATKKLRVLKQVLPEYSYFQLRLALAKGEV